MHLFYSEKLDSNGGILGKEESHHAQRVLRLLKGDIILTTQGKGTIYLSEIAIISKSVVEFLHKSIYSQEILNDRIHIAICPTKSLDRFETFLEKATEIGVTEITPIVSFHSERKIYKTERAKKVILAAAKQSMSNWLPVINEPLSLKNFIQKEISSKKFIAHCSENVEKSWKATDLANFKDKLILIGPEGDFSSEEIQQSLKNGFESISLGEKRLRTETAGIAAAIANSLLR